LLSTPFAPRAKGVESKNEYHYKMCGKRLTS